jgi:polysaccharide pyruvyl transferase WcaK-like protein
MDRIATAEVVVGTRYHNVLCAVKQAKPTISVSYSAKNDRIMADMGLGEYTQDARAVDVDRLIEQFTAVAAAAERITPALAEHSARKTALLTRQFEVLSASLGVPTTTMKEVVS